MKLHNQLYLVIVNFLPSKKVKKCDSEFKLPRFAITCNFSDFVIFSGFLSLRQFSLRWKNANIATEIKSAKQF